MTVVSTTEATGRITNVSEVPLGDVTTVDAAAGTRTLTLKGVSDFSEDGGTLAFMDDNDVTRTLTFIDVDPDLDTITLGADLPVTVTVDTFIYTYPYGYEKLAKVLIDEGSPVTAVVEQSLYEKLPEGVRDPGAEEGVTVSRDTSGEWTVVQVHGVRPTIDGSLVAPPADLWGSTPLQTHEDAVAAIEADIVAVEQEVASGDSANAQAISQAVADFNAGLATKSKHTLSPNAPGATSNNVGDVWEQHKSGDATKIIARYRGQGGTSWLPMNLDATYIPQLDIGTGTFGDLSGARILAETVGIDKLAVADFTNYLTDPLFQGLPGGWTYAGDGAYIDSSFPNKQGVASTGVLVHGPSGVYNDARSNSFDVAPGDSFSLTVDWLRNQSADGTLYVRVYWFKKDGTAASTVYHEMVRCNPTNQVITYVNGVGTTRATSNQTWYEDTGIATVPNDAATAKVYSIRSGGYTAGHWILDNMKMRRRFGGEAIIDGSLLARHVSADLVEGLLVTGRVLQTDTAANRGIKISTSGILGYDTAGVARFVVNPTTGLVSMLGGTITGAVLQTASSGERVVVRNDGSGGIVEFFTGQSGESPGYLNPEVNNPATFANPMVTLASPTGNGYTTRSYIRIRAGGSNASYTVLDQIDYVARHHRFGGDPADSSVVEIDTLGGSVFADGGFTDTGLQQASATAANINAAGRIVRASSSQRYKEQIATLTVDEARKVLDVRPVRFRWRKERDMGAALWPGFVAEEVHAAGASMWVDYDDQGRPDGVRYPEMTVAHHALLADLYARDAKREQELAALKLRLGALGK